MSDADVIPLSVVVASFSGEAAIRRCLASLVIGASGADVIVATNETKEVVDRLQVAFPLVRFHTSPGEGSVFKLRSQGVPMARGCIVALLEDHCTVAPKWSAALLAAHQVNWRIVGGTIENGLRGVYNGALYLCEYSEYMPPRAEGSASALLGPNVSYDRAALAQCQAVWREAFYDNEVNHALRTMGYQLYLSPQAVVFSHLDMNLPRAMAHLFTGGRRFGSYRRSRSTGLQRTFWVLVSPLIPAVWFARIACRVVSRRRDRIGVFLLGLPFTVGLLLAWAAGETIGYMSPEPMEV